MQISNSRAAVILFMGLFIICHCMFVGKAEQIEESQKTSLVLSLDFELAAADASSLMFMTQH